MSVCEYVCVQGESRLVKKSEWAKMLPQRAVGAVFAWINKSL